MKNAIPCLSCGAHKFQAHPSDATLLFCEECKTAQVALDDESATRMAECLERFGTKTVPLYRVLITYSGAFHETVRNGMDIWPCCDYSPDDKIPIGARALFEVRSYFRFLLMHELEVTGHDTESGRAMEDFCTDMIAEEFRSVVVDPDIAQFLRKQPGLSDFDEVAMIIVKELLANRFRMYDDAYLSYRSEGTQTRERFEAMWGRWWFHLEQALICAKYNPPAQWDKNQAIRVEDVFSRTALKSAVRSSLQFRFSSLLHGLFSEVHDVQALSEEELWSKVRIASKRAKESTKDA